MLHFYPSRYRKPHNFWTLTAHFVNAIDAKVAKAIVIRSIAAPSPSCRPLVSAVPTPLCLIILLTLSLVVDAYCFPLVTDRGLICATIAAAMNSATKKDYIPAVGPQWMRHSLPHLPFMVSIRVVASGILSPRLAKLSYSDLYFFS